MICRMNLVNSETPVILSKAFLSNNFIDIPQLLTDTSPRENLYPSLFSQTEELMPPDLKKIRALQLNVEGLSNSSAEVQTIGCDSGKS